MVSITEIDAATIDQVLAVNVRGVILGTKHAALGHAEDGFRQHHQYRQRGGTPRRPLGSRLYAPRRAPSARLPAPPRPNWAKREFASTRISPGAIVTGIFGKNAGLEGSKADQVAGVVKEIFANDPADPARGTARTISRKRRCFSPATAPGLSTARIS